MVATEGKQSLRAAGRCTLCPAGCELALAPSGPDLWRTELPDREGGGLCARGSTLGELLGHRRRILSPVGRSGGEALPVTMDEAIRRVVAGIGNGPVVFLMDGNTPCEQIMTAAAWCDRWRQASLCLVIEPSDEQLLLGVEASGAPYLSGEDLADCDGFVIVGDVFAANPCCARGLFEARHAHPRMAVVGIDPAAGTAVKFATHPLVVQPGGELQAVRSLTDGASAAAGAIERCKRLGVIIAADYGRTSAWRQIGYLAGQLAAAKGGGVACQTVGANALAAVRLAGELGTMTLAAAMSDESAARIAIGCDVAGMLGWRDAQVVAAAAALPNATTIAGEVVLPLALPCELAGTFLLDGVRPAQLPALVAPPAGVPTPAEVIALLAQEAGVDLGGTAPAAPKLDRLAGEAGEPGATPEVPSPALLLARRATHDGCGALAAHGSWQNLTQPLPVLRLAPEDARAMNVKNYATATVSVNGHPVQAAVQVSADVPAGRMVLSDGLAACRALLRSRVVRGEFVATPATVTVSV